MLVGKLDNRDFGMCKAERRSCKGISIRPTIWLRGVMQCMVWTGMLLVLHGLPQQCLGQVSSPPQSMQPKHVAHLRSVSQAVISPDGQQLAVLLSVPRKPLVDDDGPAWSELHVVGSDGVMRPFITGQVSIGAPSWSPDGKSIFYVAKRNADKESRLYSIPIDGGESSPAVTHATAIAHFAISPDGQQVAFVASQERGKDAARLEGQRF